MAQLNYSNARKYRYLDADEQFIDDDVNKVRNEILRQLLRKQLRSKVEVKSCIENKRKFTKSLNKEEGIPINIKGLMTYGDFQRLSSTKDVKEILLSYNLTSSEVELIFHDSFRANENPQVYLNQLKAIHQKLSTQQKVSGDSDLNSGDCGPPLPPDHPLNHLVDLEASLFPSSDDKDPQILTGTSEFLLDCGTHSNQRHRRKKAKVDLLGLTVEAKSSEKCVLNDAFHDVGSSYEKMVFSNMVQHGFEARKEGEFRKTNWDIKEVSNSICNRKKVSLSPKLCEVRPKSSKIIEICLKKQPACQPDLTKPFVWSLDSSLLVPLTDIEKNKIDIDVIKQDAKFQNYNPGTPSMTIYVKNLPKHFSPQKLVSVFGNFEDEDEPKIEYRILGGKMKGQAFVKFKDLDKSILAFSICNGYIIDGKPIVLEYGKH